MTNPIRIGIPTYVFSPSSILDALGFSFLVLLALLTTRDYALVVFLASLSVVTI